MSNNLEKMDIIYFLKENRENKEFRYSLRTLGNIPHHDVWLFGFRPTWCYGVNHVPYIQTMPATRWENTSRMAEMLVNNDNLTENIIIFNDDFFILNPITELPYYYEGTLYTRCEECRVGVYNQFSRYARQLKDAEQVLKKNRKTTYNYELHLPIIYNRKKLGEVLKKYPKVGYAARRSLYANECEVGGVERKDCKVYNLLDKPDGKDDFVSTTDQSFIHGATGRYIQARFDKPSKYERRS